MEPSKFPLRFAISFSFLILKKERQPNDLYSIVKVQEVYALYPELTLNKLIIHIGFAMILLAQVGRINYFGCITQDPQVLFYTRY